MGTANRHRAAVLLLPVLGILACLACTREPRRAADDELTPLASLETRSALGVPAIDPATYRLTVDGEVERPLSLSYEEILALPRVTRAVTLHCIEGWNQRAEWSGAPLALLLDRAGARRDADRVVFRTAEGYETSIRLADAYGEGMILATHVAGSVLPREHGFPVRLVAEGKYGYKWAKWVTKIRVIRGDHVGYWETFGYDNEGNVKPVPPAAIR